ncbi:glycosyl transferase [Allostella vacuolata]|nr:glycosyl transferase [Stella vacuolata]
MRLDLALPGRLDRRTGGTIYDRRIVLGLRRFGWQVAVHEMAGTYPFADDAARAAAAGILGRCGSPLLVDGLALPAFDLAARPPGCRIIALVHHPLAEETGLSPADAARLRRAERADLARVDGIIVTSPFTARALRDGYGVPADRLRAVPPGVDPVPPRAPDARPGPVRLLSVAAFVPRKGHRELFAALAPLAGEPWRMTCIGALDRDPALVADLRRQLVDAGLAGRVELAGEVGDAALAAAYGAADVFVHPAHYEGYGMALSEALRAGLPIVAVAGGAVPETVPADAGLLVPPGDVAALAAALRRIVGDPAARCALTRAAAGHGAALPDWDVAARQFADAVGAFAP